MKQCLQICVARFLALLLQTFCHCCTAVLRIEFSQMNYTGSEGSRLLSVMLLLTGGSSADDITVTVTPSDQSPVSAKGEWYTCCTVLWVWNDQVELITL